MCQGIAVFVWLSLGNCRQVQGRPRRSTPRGNVSQRRSATPVPRRPRMIARAATPGPAAGQGDATGFDGDEARSEDGSDEGSDMGGFIVSDGTV